MVIHGAQKDDFESLDVLEYKFQDLGAKVKKSGRSLSYEFKTFDSHAETSFQQTKHTMRSERDTGENQGFKLSPIVREHRGIVRMEQEERYEIIQREVSRIVEEIEEDARKKGYEDGLAQGKEDVYSETRMATEEKLESLTTMINEVLTTQQNIIKKQKDEAFTIIRNLTKWIILRELKDDGKYIERLLEKLILEMQTKTNLLIQVNKAHFEMMPEVLQVVQEKLGTLTNVRVEVDYDIDGPGLIINSDNGIINATLDQQLDSLNKIFEGVISDE